MCAYAWSKQSSILHMQYSHCTLYFHRKTQIGDYEVEQIRTARYIGPEKVTHYLAFVYLKKTNVIPILLDRLCTHFHLICLLDMLSSWYVK